ncbi:MAG: response regulator transcription factor [Clostridia bacterium]|nr:response regulator transcription factor [Clostridia bacterium]
MRILIAEDERDLNEIMRKKFKSDGYVVDCVHDGAEALDYMDSATYDAIILDIMMPKVSGLDVLKTMRSRGNNTPVILLTALDSISDKVIGLDAGANDYIVKPFSFEEIYARLRAVTRKHDGVVHNVYTVADLSVDMASRTVKRAGDVIHLSTKEFALLEYLIRHKNKVVSHEMIENNLWNFDYDGGTNATSVYIRYLRKKIDDNYEPKLIHTVRGMGYIMKEE